ncbi:peroxiredoxin-5, mitochondrial-like [Rhopilema esculentum]|uniref:peroxiredoxin-5, mitochondrial-like n=1 Tax=Rhopilema esculentum TaxID=499914 RepID=UPI0031D37A9C|eukprot:gene13704-4619_t
MLALAFARSTRTVTRSALARVAGFHSSIAVNMPIKEGDSLPSVSLWENSPGETVNIADLFKDKKGIIFGVPGAFTPGCSKTHLPGYVDDFDKLKAKGVAVVACVSVNDPFVMAAWGDHHKATGKIRMLADMKGEFAKAIDLELDATPLLGNVRCKRFAMIVENGVVKNVQVEPDGTGLTCSLSNSLLANL